METRARICLASLIKKLLEDGYTTIETHRVHKGDLTVELVNGVIRYIVDRHEVSATDAEDYLDDKFFS